jgi:hypothetical protein
VLSYGYRRRKVMKVSRGLLAGLMVALAVPVCAQSLGELAKKEQERRKAAPPAAKVYTNDDLKKIYVPGAVTAPTASDHRQARRQGRRRQGRGDGKRRATTKPPTRPPTSRTRRRTRRRGAPG